MDIHEATVVCRSLVKVYAASSGRVQAVRGVDLTLGSGVVGIIGPSGSGKSSLLRMISGLEPPTAGSVTVSGRNLANLRRGELQQVRSRLIAHVHQEPVDNLLAHLTVREQVERSARRRRADRPEVDLLLDQLGLSQRADHLPGALSGGEQQRAGFARAAVGQPTVIVADEPTAQLDSGSTARVLEVISLLGDLGICVIVATHDPQVIEAVPTIVQLRYGSIASITHADDEIAVIDQSWRLQLPPGVHDAFASKRARVGWDEGVGGLVVRPVDPTEEQAL